jgi:hypothetical protein
MIAVTARSHANLKIVWLRGGSRALNPPPPFPGLPRGGRKMPKPSRSAGLP